LILLDTHVLLWVLAHPDRIGPRSRSVIEKAATVHYSAVSIAEVTIKQMLGRLRVPDDLGAEAEAAGFVALPLRPDHPRGLEEFGELIRHDPFARLLLAQAVTERCRFLTADGRLLGLARHWILDARN